MIEKQKGLRLGEINTVVVSHWECIYRAYQSGLMIITSTVAPISWYVLT